MDQNISISISANTAALQTALAAAQSGLSEFSTQLQDLVQAVAQSGAAVDGAVQGTVGKVAAAQRELAGESRQLRQQDLRDAIASSASQLRVVEAQYQTQILEVKTAAAEKKITNEEEYQQLLEIENKKTAAVVASLQERLQLQQGNARAQTQLNDEILIAYQRLQQKKLELEQQLTREVAAENRKQVDFWKSALSEITSAEDGFVRGIFSGRQSLAQSLARLTQQMVEREISADLNWLTEHAAVNLGILGSDEATAKGGLLAHLLAEQQKTAATTAGATTRTATGATENASFVARLPGMIAQWLGLETEKTGATVTQSAARTAADAGEALAGRAASVAAGFSQIQIDAAVAAAGTMAALSAIPIVGPEIAPEAAAAAYAATLGWAAGLGGAAAAEGGMWQVPADDFLIAAHQNESVLPANIAGPMRDFFTAGNAGAGGDGSTVINVNFTNNGGGITDALILQHSNTIARAVAKEIGNRNSNLWRAGR